MKEGMSNIENFLKDNLDGKVAYVSCDGLKLEGTIEQKCKLDFIQYSGLHCSVKLADNRLGVIEQIEQILIQNRENLNITYDKRDEIINAIIPKIKDTYVQCGKVCYYGVKDILSVYNKEMDITSVEIKYINGSTIKISHIEWEQKLKKLNN